MNWAHLVQDTVQWRIYIQWAFHWYLFKQLLQ